MIAEVYTDGSCHTQHCIGAWASILFVNNQKIVLSGTEINTTHNRMEILAVINAVKHIQKNYPETSQIKIVTDSQYVIGLIRRQEKFITSNYLTKAGNEIRNIDLVKEFLLLHQGNDLVLEKIKAHQKASEIINYNIEVDKLARQLVRESVDALPNVI